jgi:hypothetical protein
MNIILVPLPKEGRDSAIEAAIFSNVKDIINLFLGKKKKKKKNFFKRKFLCPKGLIFKFLKIKKSLLVLESHQIFSL